jgi:uncharacterized protein
MTTTDGVHGLLHELTQEQCWQLLSEHHVGRIGYVERDGPVVLPLNYQVHEGRLYLRTASYNQLAAHLPGQVAAFEIDDADPHSHAGWSVLVRGRVKHVLHNSATAVPAAKPESSPWPDGLRETLFCLTPDIVTGRALRQRDVTPSAKRGPGTVQRVEVERAQPPLSH